MDIDKIVTQVTAEVMNGLAGGKKTDAELLSELPSKLELLLLRQELTARRIVEGCIDAKRARFAAVCVMPYFVQTAAECLEGSGVDVCTVVAYPYGASSAAAKAADIRDCIENGAGEIDVCLNSFAAKAGDYDTFRRDIDAVVSAVNARAKLKAVYLPELYTATERERVLAILKSSGADMISVAGDRIVPTADDVAFVKNAVGRGIGIKAGASNIEGATAMIKAGACRIGSPSAFEIAGAAAKHK